MSILRGIFTKSRFLLSSSLARPARLFGIIKTGKINFDYQDVENDFENVHYLDHFNAATELEVERKYHSLKSILQEYPTHPAILYEMLAVCAKSCDREFAIECINRLKSQLDQFESEKEVRFCFV